MKIFLNWSGGKDSAWCLHRCRQNGLPVQALVTTIGRTTGRVSMHGVPAALIRRQADALGLPLHLVEIPETGMSAYEDAVRDTHRRLAAEGFTHAASGDLYLEDLRIYREGLHAQDGLASLFPIWGVDTRTLVQDFIDAGFRAVIVCVNEHRLPASFCGRTLDPDFLQDLPEDVDPCGEAGEYHSFVYDGPGFLERVRFARGAVHRHEYPAPATSDASTAPAIPFSFLDLREG